MISIIIPLYNKATSIKRTIHSVLSQSYTDFELIIINDGSTDNSAEIVNKQFYDKRIRYIYQDNAGVSSARNRGIKEAIGEWILFLDADDILYPNALKILISKSVFNTNIEHNMAFVILPSTSFQISSCIYGISNNFIKKCIESKKKI